MSEREFISKRIAIVCDDSATIDLLTSILNENGFDTNSHKNGKEFVKNFDLDACHCVIIDLEIQKNIGLELFKRLRKANPVYLPPTVFIGRNVDIPTIVDAIKSGAMNYVQSDTIDVSFIEKIETIIQSDEQARNRWREKKQIQDRIMNLSSREREVLDLLLQGKSNKQIAYVLGISTKTVETHRARVLKKMEINTPFELTPLLFG